MGIYGHNYGYARQYRVAGDYAANSLVDCRDDEFKGAWRAMGTLAPNRLSALRRVATIESIGSLTRIEGRKLSDSDVERLLSNIEIRHFATRDEQEVAGYAEVIRAVAVGVASHTAKNSLVRRTG
jgi:hypothetical protein